MCETSWLSCRKKFMRGGEDNWPFLKIKITVSIVLSLFLFINLREATTI